VKSWKLLYNTAMLLGKEILNSLSGYLYIILERAKIKDFLFVVSFLKLDIG